jgi:hypothetical protein
MRLTFGNLSSLLTLGSSLILLGSVNVGLVIEEIALLGSVVGGDELFIVRHVVDLGTGIGFSCGCWEVMFVWGAGVLNFETHIYTHAAFC